MNKDIQKRILTGMRPTGKLHLGHYVGALENWIKLQHEYECYFLIADYQALGDHAGQTQKIREAVIDITLDWLSVGLDPEKTSFVVQSYIPEHAELTMLLSMVTPMSMVNQNPTLKTEIAQKKTDLSVGFYNYPVSEAADILLPQADLVPAGEDQMPHVEMTREIVRKFNRIYGDVLKEPEGLVGRIPRLIGIDGNAKASKSLNNAIFLSDSPEEVKEKVMKMYTDPLKIKLTDKGHIEGNVVFTYLNAFAKIDVETLKERYREGAIGDVELKQILIKEINNFLDPIREKRKYYMENMHLVHKALNNGTERARKVSQETIIKVKEAMGLLNY